MPIFKSSSQLQLNAGLAMIRIIAGTVFAVHGAQKLFVYGFAGVTGAFAEMGVPMPELIGPAMAILEFAGGLALIAGLLTRPIALGLAVEMLAALVIVHLPNGFFLPNGYEFVLMLFGAGATLGVTGAGAWSVDAVIARRLASPSSSTTPDALRERAMARAS